ncbi:probable serine/threonine-protein kinase WNK5 [Vicia villosa]|uniref:probable serine/threonine-protein kinase WNK5 n=1 Tax=Vicia villosa TaxID=3911 RepID=UPI00273BB363|nr:probable serine/threonine-protein kinase WNK5 [Vicia villosa]
MYKGRFCTSGGIKVPLGYVEKDPSGRYGRYRDILGRGAMKTVYRAFDEFLGIEVAWNQVKLGDVFHSPEQLQRLYSEVHLLKHLHHKSMMIFYGSWIDLNGKTFNFITELFTSGTLREYRQKYKRVDIQALKNWTRQILSGLEYLHTNNPPVIHRDLKCDNIFVNGHKGEIKIGDLGLAAILCKSQLAQSVIGTPEFMAPELYEEKYNELVDIYSFGMCMIEMLTLEFPYNECSNPAQIYKKVTSGKLPNAFFRIKDLEAQRFVGRCLAHVSKRPSARELLLDPFLDTEKVEVSLLNTTTNQTLKVNSTQALANYKHLSISDPSTSTNMKITGSINEDNTIFLKVRICDEIGKTRHIFFPFDTKNDTAIKVAMEMVEELEISHLEPLEIAAMIDNEISNLFPTWMGSHGKCEHQLQHSFNYQEDEDLNNHNPFVVSSSSCPSSPLDSLRSMNSYKSSSFRYHHEDELGQRIEKEAAEAKHNKLTCIRSCRCGGAKMEEHRSMQLQRWELLEEVYKRRMFNTVATMEGIGFQHPDGGGHHCGR